MGIIVDATKITLEEFGQTGRTLLSSALATRSLRLVDHFTHKMGSKLPEKVLKANQESIRRGYEEVQQG